MLVDHCANRLKQDGSNVLHGAIREVSLVLSPANPGATIDNLMLEHSDGSVTSMDDEAIMKFYSEIEVSHSDDEKTEEKETEEVAKEEKGRTVADVYNEFTEEQKKVVAFIVGQALEDAGVAEEEEVEHTDNEEQEEETEEVIMHNEEGEEGEEMKHNVFNNNDNERRTLSREDFQTIFADAKRCGSLRDAVLMHMEEGGVLAHAVYNHDDAGNQTTEQTYGIADINYLFPDAKTITSTPDFIAREQDWVKKVINGTHHTPFSRVKSIHANITNEEARARGYLKGNLKTEEVFSLLKRSTDPQTIYKKQKLDRDDIIDITDFDVVAWLKAEMRMMLEEEIARAILIGDGRLNSDDDKISPDHIRPILGDAALYSVPKTVNGGDDLAENFIDECIRARKDYKGSGNPTLFTTEDMLTEMLLIKDTIGHKIYKSEAELATALRVKEIVTVPVMEGLKDANNKDVAGIIVNLRDYNIGADKGGQTSMFDDFDIDYNQYKYLIETRCSGALVKPYSALVFSVNPQ